ncbi:hypothetical protein F5Y15DRAFT_430106 [Xylariaceae sp. FL0016]|nr:hypothetical protein F5Y15DRAFT_430106 [Xylariaceae sp. FL0016]
MSIGGDGPYCIAVLWSLTAIVALFLVLRVYARVYCLASYGVDDHFYAVSFVLMVAYSAMATVAAYHGYGRSDLSPAANVDATYYRMIAQTFSLLAVGTSKASVGSFLLRIVFAVWMKVAIWTVMVIMGILSILGALFTWVGCQPLAFSYDKHIPGGSCLNTVPISYMLAMGTIGVDILFAVLPWTFIWKLKAPRRERIVIAGSMSLGILAALAGAKRILSVNGVRDVPVGVIVWSQVETALTLICVGISVCGPIWFHGAERWVRSRRSSSYARHETPEPVALRTIGGGAMPGAKAARGSQSQGTNNSLHSLSLFSKTTGTTKTMATATTTTTMDSWKSGNGEKREVDDRDSDEVKVTREDHEQTREERTNEEAGHQWDGSQDNLPTRAHQVKRSWILGETSNHSLAQGRVGHFDNGNDRIITSMSFEVKRS